MQTRLAEQFSLGFTDPLYNAVCLNATNGRARYQASADPSQCAAIADAHRQPRISGLAGSPTI